MEVASDCQDLPPVAPRATMGVSQQGEFNGIPGRSVVEYCFTKLPVLLQSTADDYMKRFEAYVLPK